DRQIVFAAAVENGTAQCNVQDAVLLGQRVDGVGNPALQRENDGHAFVQKHVEACDRSQWIAGAVHIIHLERCAQFVNGQLEYALVLTSDIGFRAAKRQNGS